MVFVKQFGLQRSGTNIIKALIEVNYSDVLVLTNTLGPKHLPTTWDEISKGLNDNPPVEDYIKEEELASLRSLVDSRDLDLVINLKDPLSWLESYYRYSHKKILNKNPSASWDLTVDFCKSNLPKWEKNVSSWIKLASEANHCVIVKHEEILVEPEEVMKRIEDKLALADRRTSEELVCRLDGYAKPGSEQHRGTDLLYKGKKFDSSYHTERMWIENFPTDALGYSLKEVKLMRERNPALAEHIPKYV